MITLKELLLSLKKMQDSLNAKVDKMYTMLKYLVGSRHQTPVRHYHYTCSSINNNTDNKN